MDKLENDRYQIDQIAEEVRNACIKAAREGFRDASTSGLCIDGAVEAAVGAMQSLNLEEIVNKSSKS